MSDVMNADMVIVWQQVYEATSAFDNQNRDLHIWTTVYSVVCSTTHTTYAHIDCEHRSDLHEHTHADCLKW